MENARQNTRWRAVDVFSELVRDVLEYAEAMSRAPQAVTDEPVDRLRAQLGSAAVVDLTSVVVVP
ncbi:hypothetical protein, partial [Actinoplanes rishiriensis]|uniref:hypothetical protein n=1 Tax=Paractinoplanes rishiriensis TaxID=1050105 RepID=UPI001EF19DF4